MIKVKKIKYRECMIWQIGEGKNTYYMCEIKTWGRSLDSIKHFIDVKENMRELEEIKEKLHLKADDHIICEDGENYLKTALKKIIKKQEKMGNRK